MAYYDQRSPGLGLRFKQSFYSAADDIVVFPEKYAVKAKPGIRTRLMRPFPYLVFYAIENATVFVLAVKYAGLHPDSLRSVARKRQNP
jgi:hypothetical protein